MTDIANPAPDPAALLQSVPGVVAVVDEFGVVQWVSDSVTEVAGYLPEELVGTEIVDHIDLAWNPHALESILFALTHDGEQYPTVLGFRPKDGSEPIIIEATANNQIANPLIRGLVAHLQVCGEDRLVDRILESSASGHRLEATLDRLYSVASARTMQADTVVILRPADGTTRVLGSEPGLDQLVALGDAAAPWNQAARSLEPVLVGDVAQLSLDLREKAYAWGYVGCWAYPVPRLDANDAAAVLVFWSRRTGEPEPNAAMLADRLATLLALVLDRHQHDDRTQAM